MLPVLDNKTRAKYAVIRLRNILKRFPSNVIKNDPIIVLLTKVSDKLWNSIKYFTPCDQDIAGIQEAADSLEKALEIIDGEDDK